MLLLNILGVINHIPQTSKYGDSSKIIQNCQDIFQPIVIFSLLISHVVKMFVKTSLLLKNFVAFIRMSEEYPKFGRCMVL